MLIDERTDPRWLRPYEFWRDITTTDADNEVAYDTTDCLVKITVNLPGDQNQMIQKTYTVRLGTETASLESGFDASKLEIGSYVEYQDFCNCHFRSERCNVDVAAERD